MQAADSGGMSGNAGSSGSSGNAGNMAVAVVILVAPVAVVMLVAVVVLVAVVLLVAVAMLIRIIRDTTQESLKGRDTYYRTTTQEILSLAASVFTKYQTETHVSHKNGSVGNSGHHTRIALG